MTERLERDMPDYYRILMVAYANLKDFHGAIQYGEEALRYERAIGGIDTSFYRVVVEDLEALERLSELTESLDTD
jgi:hypothetical protein